MVTGEPRFADVANATQAADAAYYGGAAAKAGQDAVRAAYKYFIEKNKSGRSWPPPPPDQEEV